MMNDFDPYEALQNLANNQNMLDHNQKQIIMAVNDLQKRVADHQQWLELNQTTINQVLSSLQNQYTMIMTMLNNQVLNQPVNTDNKGNGANDQTSNSNQSG